MLRITEEAAMLLLKKSNPNSPVAKEIRESFPAMESETPDFWNGVLAGLVRAVEVNHREDLPPGVRNVLIEEMVAEASRRFLGSARSRLS